MAQNSLLPNEIAAAQLFATRVPADLRQKFVARVAAWKATWPTLSSNTHDYAQGQAFQDLASLGPAAAPLVVEQLATLPDGFFLLPLLERWNLYATAANSGESEQHRAVRAAIVPRT